MNAPHLHTYSTPQAGSAAVAAELRAMVARQPQAVVGLPTGGTPQALYAEMVRLAREEAVDWTSLVGFNLDEYWPIDAAHPASFRTFMRQQLVEPAGCDAARFHIPSGEVQRSEIEAHLGEYQQAIRQAGGLQLQLLGIGLNGHIGFNEPGSAADSEARLVELAAVTRERARDQFGGSPVPTHGITLGIADILRAQRIIVMAFGAEKSSVVHSAIEGEVSDACPASLLRHHANVTWVLDTPAASELSLMS